MRCILALICLAITIHQDVQADKPEVELLAVEYPPFTSQSLTDHGLSFSKLGNLIGEQFSVKPVFALKEKIRMTIISLDTK